MQTDNAWTYTYNRDLRDMLAERGIAHRTIPPRTPRRNGKVERYQQTLAREWAYGQRYRDSHARAAALPIWLHHYNFTRDHCSLSNRPPISRVRNQPRHDTHSRAAGRAGYQPPGGAACAVDPLPGPVRVAHGSSQRRNSQSRPIHGDLGPGAGRTSSMQRDP